MIDVARAANVTPQTVSRAIRNAPEVSEETRERVLRIARELNYVKLGENILNKFIEELSDVSVPEKKPLLEGKNMFIILQHKSIK